MKNMNCVSTMPEIMPEITDEAIIEALFAQRPYEEKVINSAFLEIPAEYQLKLNLWEYCSVKLFRLDLFVKLPQPFIFHLEQLLVSRLSCHE